MTHRPAQQSARRTGRRPDVCREFHAFAPCTASKSREIDSMAPADRFDSKRVAVPDRRGQRRVSSHSINAFRSREISGFHPVSTISCPGWASVEGETPVAALRPAPMSLVRCLYNGCVIARCGFGDLAFDSMRERRAGGHEPLVAVPTRQSRCQLEVFENT
jgi:hypothetical protein